MDLEKILREVIKSRAKQRPVPEVESLVPEKLNVVADRDRLGSAFEHVIQNAQEAAGRKGTVQVRLESMQNKAIVDVEDSGHGMDEIFIRTRLFKPFDTTKGLTGMGIGAYESREYIRSLGGDIHVQSSLNNGTLFRFVIPLVGGEQGAAVSTEGAYV